MAHKQPSTLVLPPAIAGVAELSRVLREIALLNDHAAQSAIRRPGGGAVALPAVSYLLDELATSNELNLNSGAVRNELRRFLEDIKAHAPVVYIGFAHEATSDEIGPIIGWIRTELHSMALVRVGLQPGIIGGCTIRTPNHYYDFSLKQHFEAAREALLSKVGAL